MTTQVKRAQDDDNDIPELDVTKAKVIRRGPKHPLGPRMSLKLFREGLGKTQGDVAEGADMAQGDVSRLEQQADAKLSTLRRYVEALGGKLNLVVTFATGHRMRIELGDGKVSDSAGGPRRT